MQAQAALYSLNIIQLDEDAKEKQVCLLALLVIKYIAKVFAADFFPAGRMLTYADVC